MPELIHINRHLSIPYEELRWRFSRAGRPGGQNVNHTATRVELLFDVGRAPSLSEEQRALLLERLSALLDSDGILRVTAQSERSQLQNRHDAVIRFSMLLRSALVAPTSRIATRVPRFSRERRLSEKRRAQVRRNQRRVPPDD